MMMLHALYISTAFLIVLCNQANAQGILPNQESVDLHTLTTHPHIRHTNTDVLVLDGQVVNKKDMVHRNIETVRKLVLTDYTDLKKLNIQDSLRTYGFFETEKTALYNAIYIQVRNDIPWTLWDMKMPILVNGKLKDNLKDLNIDEVQHIAYIARKDLSRDIQDQLLYGAIAIQKK